MNENMVFFPQNGELLSVLALPMDDYPAQESLQEDATLEDGVIYEAQPQEVCHEIKLGSMHVPEVKTDTCWLKIGPMKTKVPCVKTRTSEVALYASVCLPQSAGDRAVDMVKSCALTSIGGAALAAIANPAAALPAFKTAFIACLTAKGADFAKQVSVGLHTKKKPGPWHRRV